MDIDETREKLIADVCLAEGEEDAVARVIADRVAGLDLPAQTRSELASSAWRLLLYRRLVRGNLESAVRRMLPRTAACLDAGEGPGFAGEFGAFLAERGPRTHHLRDVGIEFVVWGAQRWVRGDFPPWLRDIARYEGAEFEVGIAEAPPPPPTTEGLSLERPLVFQPTTRLLLFAYAVHEDTDPPDARPVAVILFRDADHAVHAREIATGVAPVIALLFRGKALGQAVREAFGARDSAAPVADASLAHLAEVLAGLASEGILLGARAD